MIENKQIIQEIQLLTVASIQRGCIMMGFLQSLIAKFQRTPMQ